jgi:hypothetical protein
MIGVRVLRKRGATAMMLALLLVGTQVPARPRRRDLTQPEARALVIEALDQSARKLPGLTFKFYSRAKASNFYELAVLWNNPNGSAIVGHFAVNRATGDVWRLVLCTRVESAALRRLQQTLRKRIGLGSEEFHKLESEAPCELWAVERFVYSASAR